MAVYFQTAGGLSVRRDIITLILQRFRGRPRTNGREWQQGRWWLRIRKNIWKGTEQWRARVNSPDSDLSLQVFKQRLNLHFSGMCESASLDRKWNEMSKMLWFQLNCWDMGLWTPLEAGKRTVRQTFCKSHINQAPPSVPFGSRLINKWVYHHCSLSSRV